MQSLKQYETLIRFQVYPDVKKVRLMKGPGLS